MSLPNLPPDMLRIAEDHERRIYELERRMVPELGSTAAPAECCVVTVCDSEGDNNSQNSIAANVTETTCSAAITAPALGSLIMCVSVQFAWSGNVQAGGGAEATLTHNGTIINSPLIRRWLWPSACPAAIQGIISYIQSRPVSVPGIQTVSLDVQNLFTSTTSIAVGSFLQLVYVPGPTSGCGGFVLDPE